MWNKRLCNLCLLFHIMIRHNVDFCKNEPRFMPLIIFHWNCILLLMMEMNKKQFLFHSWKIRAEGWIPLIPFWYHIFIDLNEIISNSGPVSHNIRSGQKTFRPERQNTIIFIPGHNIRYGPRNIYLFWAHINLLKLNLNN